MFFLVLGLAVVAADQYFKHKINSNPDFREHTAAGGRIRLTCYHNRGAFLNFMEKRGRLVLIITTLLFGALLSACGFIVCGKKSRLLAAGLTLMAGGAASNLFDRYRHGYVVDYFSFKIIPRIVFNLGDLAIFLGALLSVPGAGARRR